MSSGAKSSSVERHTFKSTLGGKNKYKTLSYKVYYERVVVQLSPSGSWGVTEHLGF